jgi:hypothetical protein
MRVLLLLALVAGACRGGGGDLERAPLPAPDEVAPVRGPAPRSPRNANYNIRASYDAERRRITASQTLRWTHDGREAVAVLPFHLYMNAFKSERTVFWRESGGRLRTARGDAAGEGWGWIAVSRVAVDGAAVPLERLRFPGPDETVLEVPLPAPLDPGGEVRVDLDFQVQLPEVFARTGYKGDFAMVGQWFPKIGVRVASPGDPSRERWHCEPFHANSEFFADFGTYDVELTVPSSHVVAATGVLREAVDIDGGLRRLRFRAEDVHDFAWMIDPHMEIIRGTAATELGEVEVRVYHRPGQRRFAERHLAAGVGAIESFSRRTLPYPWPIMSIISPPPKAASGAGGMEYPTLVTTAGDFFFSAEGVRLPELVTVHEVGHNWFQGILASNEIDEAWLDEGVNEYVDSLVMNELYGHRASQIDHWGFRADPFLLRRALLAPLDRNTDPITTVSYEFASPRSYANATYQRTALALRTLETIVGSEAFARAMRAYARRFAFRHPTGDDFFATLEAELGADIDWFVEPAFRGRGAATLVVHDVSCRRAGELRGVTDPAVPGAEPPDWPELPTSGYRCEIVVANLGEIAVPFDVEIEIGGEQRLRRSLPRHLAHHRIVLDVEEPVTAVTIDPDNRILVNGAGLASLWRAETRGGPAAGASARLQHWTQVLLQIAGL